jgi:hypothetical protein
MYGSVTAENCTLTGNTAAGGMSTSGGSGGHGGNGDGGALFNLDGTVSLTGATLSGNTVSAGKGDAGNGSSGGSAVYNLAYGSSPTGAAQTASLIAVNSGLDSTNLVNNQDTTKNAGDQALAITLSSYSGTYDGTAHSGAGTAVGGTKDLSSYLTLPAHTNAGTYTDAWSFHDPTPTGAYPDAGGTITDSIAQAPLTITADSKSKVYGNAISALTASYSGLVNGDTSAVVSGLTLSTTATIASGVGSYSITASGASAANYSISYVAGSLSVTAAPLTITADSKTKVYGEANPALTASYSGLVNGDTSAVVSGLTLSTTATAASDVGSYSITASGASAANYSISYVAGTLTINARPITITANDQSKIYGTVLSLGTSAFTVTGSMATGEVVTSVTLTSATDQAASTTAPVGTYTDEIVPSNPSGTGGYLASNYQITFVNGTLTVLSYSQATAALLDQVDNAGLPDHLTDALDKKLEAAIDSFDQGKTKAGVNHLEAFIDRVTAQRGQGIDAALAKGWIDAAQGIIDAVG